MTTRTEQMDQYAKLAVQVGVNIQPKQTLVINAPLVAAEFVRKVANHAYQAGAKNVHVEWRDEQLTLLKYEQAPDEAFSEYPLWKAKGFEEMAEDGAAFLSIVASDPDLLKNADPERVATANKTAGKAMNTFRTYIQSDKVSWNVLAIPSPEWARKVFPNEENESQSVQRLWQAIFQAVRVDQDDPVQAWQEHNANLRKKASYLNEKKFHKLHYKAPGTDLTIELPEGHIWAGGGSTNADGTDFVPNIPTEEVFTVPHKEGVNGVVRNTLPLNYSGNIIDDFSLTFENGRIVDVQAKVGEETLKRLIDTDEGAHYLGEVALVPHDSPISNTDTIFYTTLFDENASCHLAIGSAYAFCIEGGTEMSPDELEKHGANQSITHVDFMMGSAELNIDGETADGERVPLFRNGNWV